MEINKINQSKEVQSTSQVDKVSHAQNQNKEVVSNDKVSFSDESKMQALYTKAMDVIKKTPDVREDKIEEAKRLLESFKNPSNEILKDVAQKILAYGDLGFSS